jgi:hypothetical protein
MGNNGGVKPPTQTARMPRVKPALPGRHVAPQPPPEVSAPPPVVLPPSESPADIPEPPSIVDCWLMRGNRAHHLLLSRLEPGDSPPWRDLHFSLRDTIPPGAFETLQRRLKFHSHPSMTELLQELEVPNEAEFWVLFVRNVEQEARLRAPTGQENHSVATRVEVARHWLSMAQSMASLRVEIRDVETHETTLVPFLQWFGLHRLIQLQSRVHWNQEWNRVRGGLRHLLSVQRGALATWIGPDNLAEMIGSFRQPLFAERFLHQLAEIVLGGRTRKGLPEFFQGFDDLNERVATGVTPTLLVQVAQLAQEHAATLLGRWAISTTQFLKQYAHQPWMVTQTSAPHFADNLETFHGEVQTKIDEIEVYDPRSARQLKSLIWNDLSRRHMANAIALQKLAYGLIDQHELEAEVAFLLSVPNSVLRRRILPRAGNPELFTAALTREGLFRHLHPYAPPADDSIPEPMALPTPEPQAHSAVVARRHLESGADVLYAIFGDRRLSQARDAVAQTLRTLIADEQEDPDDSDPDREAG